MIGAKSSASALPEHDPCAGDATGLAVAVTVGFGAIRCEIRTCKPVGFRALLQNRPHIKAKPVGKQQARVSFRGAPARPS